MRRILSVSVWAVCLGLGIGCGGGSDDRQREEARDDDDIDITETTPQIETGCLTSAGDRFVLTALEGGGGAETQMYQLVGTDDDLRKHVGKEVRVTGVAEPAQVAELRESSPSTATGTAGTKEGSQPQVRTEAQTRLETRRMRVATITPTGDDCPAAR